VPLVQVCDPVLKVFPGYFALSTLVYAACWLGAYRSHGAVAPPYPLVLKVVEEVCCDVLPGLLTPRLRLDTDVPVLLRVWCGPLITCGAPRALYE